MTTCYYTHPEILYLYDLDTMLVRHVIGSFMVFHDTSWTLSCRTLYGNATLELSESIVRQIAEQADSDAALHKILHPCKIDLLQKAIQIKEHEIDLQNICNHAKGYIAKENKPVAILDSTALTTDTFFAQGIRFLINEEKIILTAQENEIFKENALVEFFLWWNNTVYKITCMCRQHIFYVQKACIADNMWRQTMFASNMPAWKIAEQAKEGNSQMRSLFASLKKR